MCRRCCVLGRVSLCCPGWSRSCYFDWAAIKDMYHQTYILRSFFQYYYCCRNGVPLIYKYFANVCISDLLHRTYLCINVCVYTWTYMSVYTSLHNGNKFSRAFTWKSSLYVKFKKQVATIWHHFKYTHTHMISQVYCQSQ